MRWCLPADAQFHRRDIMQFGGLAAGKNRVVKRYVPIRLGQTCRGGHVTPARLNVNGQTVTVNIADGDTPLLYVLRNELGLRGPRFGCGLAQCGACTVLVDGQAVRSCVTPLSSVTGKVVTLEGLGQERHLHPVQRAFIAEQAVQCGYCINGMIMQSAALLAQNSDPTDDQIKSELANNLCRCGTHLRIVRAVKRAAAEMRKAEQ
jgi:nicotinate dehydrogenase subunit A